MVLRAGVSDNRPEVQQWDGGRPAAEEEIWLTEESDVGVSSRRTRPFWRWR